MLHNDGGYSKMDDRVGPLYAAENHDGQYSVAFMMPNGNGYEPQWLEVNRGAYIATIDGNRDRLAYVDGGRHWAIYFYRLDWGESLKRDHELHQALMADYRATVDDLSRAGW